MVVSVFISSCKQHTVNQIERSVIEGEWVIFSFIEDGKNLTQTGYSEYIFEFDKNGDMFARIPTLGVVLPGKWSSFKAEKKVIFELKVISPLQNINEKWEVLVNNKSSISLKATAFDGKIKTMVINKKN